MKNERTKPGWPKAWTRHDAVPRQNTRKKRESQATCLIVMHDQGDPHPSSAEVGGGGGKATLSPKTDGQPELKECTLT